MKRTCVVGFDVLSRQCRAGCRALAASPGLCQGQEGAALQEQLTPRRQVKAPESAGLWEVLTAASEPEKKKGQDELRIGKIAVALLKPSFWKGARFPTSRRVKAVPPHPRA